MKETPKKIRRENIGQHLVEYELAMVGKTLKDAMDDDKWYFNFTLTQEQHDEFKKYSLALIRKIFKCNKAQAERTFSWFDLSHGLRIKN